MFLLFADNTLFEKKSLAYILLYKYIKVNIYPKFCF